MLEYAIHSEIVKPKVTLFNFKRCSFLNIICYIL